MQKNDKDDQAGDFPAKPLGQRGTSAETFHQPGLFNNCDRHGGEEDDGDVGAWNDQDEESPIEFGIKNNDQSRRQDNTAVGDAKAQQREGAGQGMLQGFAYVRGPALEIHEYPIGQYANQKVFE